MPMSYVAEVLQPDEVVRFRTNVHGLVYWRAAIAGLIGLGLLIWYYADGKTHLLILIGAIVFLVTAVLLGLPAWLKRFGTEVAVTDRRVIYKTGIFQRRTIEISMDKIESVDVEQSILGRLFGYGSVTVRGTGEAVEPLRDIADPIPFRNAIMVR
jgi:uncharacterized membrane protein YdbT with pleckstrin-like domain